MKKNISIFIIFFFLVSITSCATTNPDGTPNTAVTTGIGAAAGAATGALIGFAKTGDAKGALTGALIGAGVGALTGFIVGKVREKTHKNADQVYKEKTKLAMESAKNDPPEIGYFQPCIRNIKTGKELNAVKKGEWVELGADYEIDIPKYSKTQQVELVEYNTLVSSDGKKMENPELTRVKMRPCSAVTSGIEVQIPKDLQSGKYTHLATLRVGDKEYKKEQQVVVL